MIYDFPMSFWTVVDSFHVVVLQFKNGIIYDTSGSL